MYSVMCTPLSLGEVANFISGRRTSYAAYAQKLVVYKEFSRGYRSNFFFVPTNVPGAVAHIFRITAVDLELSYC